jgi:hypothetical protein
MASELSTSTIIGSWCIVPDRFRLRSRPSFVSRGPRDSVSGELGDNELPRIDRDGRAPDIT